MMTSWWVKKFWNSLYWKRQRQREETILSNFLLCSPFLVSIKKEWLGADQVLCAADFMNVGDVSKLWDEDRMCPGGLWRGTLRMCFCSCTAAQRLPGTELSEVLGPDAWECLTKISQKMSWEKPPKRRRASWCKCNPLVISLLPCGFM